jgi:hypothetical protein
MEAVCKCARAAVDCLSVGVVWVEVEAMAVGGRRGANLKNSRETEVAVIADACLPKARLHIQALAFGVT